MNYRLHRVAPNTNGWTRPSSGRLGAKGVGPYVEKHGFGHEDWNFNFEFSSKGKMLGYTVARPAQDLADQTFCVVLATYDPGGWKAVGYYEDAQYKVDAGNPPAAALQQMAIDVFELAEAEGVSSEYQGRTLKEISEIIQTEFVHHCWSIPRDKVYVFENPVGIPMSLFNPGTQRMKVPNKITSAQFREIVELGPKQAAPDIIAGMSEGRRILVLHQRFERNQKLVSAFKNSLSSFECVVCGFDFEEEYGAIGRGFIECHHTRPVAEMRSGQKTKLTDLAAVCSNCHRMLHRNLPMPTIDNLRRLRNLSK